MPRLIVDTDLAMGAPQADIDDGFALALVAADPSLQLEMITTVNGNTDVDTATVLTDRIADRLGCGDVPIYRGAAAPITQPGSGRRTASTEPTSPARVNPEPAPTSDRVRPGHAAVAIAAHIVANPGEITVLAIGPLTNIALAIALEPRLPELVHEIVIMGGVFLGGTGRGGMPGEFNVWVDPESAAAVLRSGARQRWVGLDVTRQVRLARDTAMHMCSSTSDFARFAGAATADWIDYLHANNPGDPASADSCAMHDPLAVAAISRPDLLTFTNAHVDVVTGSGPARGVMVTDLRYGRQPPAANCAIATAVDIAGAHEYFRQAIDGLG